MCEGYDAMPHDEWAECDGYYGADWREPDADGHYENGNCSCRGTHDEEGYFIVMKQCADCKWFVEEGQYLDYPEDQPAAESAEEQAEQQAAEQPEEQAEEQAEEQDEDSEEEVVSMAACSIA